jgi:hypothetical protein
MLPLGKTLKKEYILVHELWVTQVDIPKYSENIRDTLIQNLVQWKEVIVRFLGWRDQTHIYVEKKSQNGESLLGIMGTNGFIPLKSFSSSPQNIRLDETGEYFLVSYSSGETTILKRDLSTEFIIHSRTPIRSITGFPNEWKIRMMDTVFEYDGEKLRENQRFTDYIDLDSRYRLGYIAPQDTEKLQLSNLPIGNWVLVLLDRTHGTSQIIARSVLINILSFFQWSPIYQDQEGKSWKIDTSHFIQSWL